MYNPNNPFQDIPNLANEKAELLNLKENIEKEINEMMIEKINTFMKLEHLNDSDKKKVKTQIKYFLKGIISTDEMAESFKNFKDLNDRERKEDYEAF